MIVAAPMSEPLVYIWWRPRRGCWAPCSGKKRKERKNLANVAIANALHLEAARRRAVPIATLVSSPVSSLISLSLSVAVLERFYCTLRYAVTLNFYLWPWTFVVCRLCHGQTLYQIWAKSGNPRRSYWYLTLWPWTFITCYAMLWDSLHKV